MSKIIIRLYYMLMYFRNGYVSLFLKRIGTYDEGCATFYRTTKFECQTSELIHLIKATHDLLCVSSCDKERITLIHIVNSFDNTKAMRHDNA